MLGRQLAVATVCSSILSSRAALVPSVTEYAVDGIPGYTTYRLVVELDDTERNCYTLVGAADHRTTIPAAYNVAPPFGVSKGGVNPAYFPYNSEAEYDSWLTVGPNTENTYVGSQMGTVGIDFESWTPDRALEFNNGAIFWMSPNDGASGDVLLAQLTIPTGRIWHATIGELQGRSFSGGADWNEYDIPFSNAVAVSGCMQSGATNYDPAATVPTECVWPVSGCMQSGATNYDPAATVPTECVWPVSGCMQSGATNFDPDATISDGSCVFDYCASMPCQNGAACFSSAGSYLCQCTSGFVGVDCQVSIDFCASAPCENGGICTSGSGGYQCTCNIGFVGTNCETLEDSSNGCTPPTICPSHLDPVCGSDGVDYGNPCLATCAQPFSEGRCADHEPDPGLGVDPTAPCRRNCDYAHATPTTHEVGVDLVLGYTTLQFGVHLGPQAFNVYALAGTAENPTYIPPARLDPSFHTDVGGPSTMFWTMFPELQYDSFLTIGCIGSDVCASHGTISHVGIPWQDWSQTTPMVIGELGNELSGGSMFFMNPDDGPEATAGHPEDDTIVLAQLTVPTQTPFTMLVGEIQGRTECPGGCDPGERRPPDWDAFDLQWDSPWGGAPVPGTDIGQVFGCTRSTSVNYNPDATIDDGSCQQCTWDTDMPAVMNTCCGHRRMLSEGVTCEALPDTCPSIDCAELFIGFFESCGSRLQREGLFEQYGFFAANCELLLAESQLPPDAAIGRPFLAIGATSATTSISVLNHGSDWLAEL